MDSRVAIRIEPSLDLVLIPRCSNCNGANPRGLSRCPQCNALSPPVRRASAAASFTGGIPLVARIYFAIAGALRRLAGRMS